LDSKASDESDVQPEKQNRERRSTEQGIQIELSDAQSENADLPIRTSLEFGSNKTIASAVQPKKQKPQSLSTEAGILIDTSDEQNENAEDSMRASLESDSKSNEESDLH
jgi:hypothetical protein